MRPTRIDRRTVLRASAAGSLWALSTACTGADDGDDTTRRTSSGRSTVAPPAAMVRTSWSVDPWSFGSYSYLPVGADPAQRRTLATPVGERLVFAGEATSSTHPSTVHGALDSGRRAADAVLAVAVATDRIVVVGAGIAGVTVARTLAAEGLAVTVIEARERVGGRLDTVEPTGWPIPIELGASWVHDVDAGDLADRLAAEDVAAVPFTYEQSAIDDGGVRVASPEGLLEPAERTLAMAIDWASDQEQDVSIAEAIDRSGAAEATEVDPSVLASYLDAELDTELGASAAELSARWGLEEGSDGDDLLVLGGYSTIASAASAGLDVELGRPITVISRSDDGVVLEDATGATVDAERVVVTVPLGVLQAGSLSFDPPLPDTHRAAIEALGMGLLDKFWFRFDEQFWSEPAEMWTRIAPADTAFAEWFNLAPATGEPVLLALMGGPLARDWATRSDDEVIRAATSSLQDLLDAGW